MPKNGPNAEWSLSEELARSQQLNARMDSATHSVPTSTQHISAGSQEANVTILQSDTQSELTAGVPLESQTVAYVQEQTGSEPSHSNQTNVDDESLAPDSTADAEVSPASSRPAFADQQDDVVIGQLIERLHTAIPGDTVSFEFSVLNNGPEIAVFSPQLIGAIPQKWMDISPSHTRLHPGELASLEVTIRLPRMTTLRPDTYPLAIVIRAGGPTGRYCQMGVQLQVKPFINLQLGTLEPSRIEINWRNPVKNLILPVTNQGNEVVDVRLEGYDSANLCDFQFSLLSSRRGPNLGALHQGMLQQPTVNGADGHFLLHPGQTHYAPISVRYRQPHLFAVKRSATSLAIGAYTRQGKDGAEEPNYSTNASARTRNGQSPNSQPWLNEEPWTMQGRVIGKATYRPFIGPGAILTVAGAGILGILGLTLTLLLIVLSLYPKARPSQAPQTIPLSAPAAQNQAAFEIIVKVNEIVPPSEARLAAENGAIPEGVNSIAQVSEMAVASSVEALPTAIVVEPLSGNRAENEADRPRESTSLAIPAEGQNQSSAQQNGNTSADSNNNSAAGVNNTQNNNRITANGVPIVQPSMVTSPEEAAATNPVAQTSSLSRVGNNSGGVSSEQASARVAPAANTMTYEQMFRLVAVDYDLDWRMLAAQAYVESSFNPLAQGRRGDLGLMQILPDTWQEWSPRAGVQDPFDSYSNVIVAATYLDYLRGLLERQGYPDDKWVLTAYNWGPNRVIDFLNAGGNWDALSDQRKKYATDVIRIANSLPEN